jgi:hypothetical protein
MPRTGTAPRIALVTTTSVRGDRAGADADCGVEARGDEALGGLERGI